MANDPEPSQATLPGGHIPALDGVRGLAILLVLWEHFGPPQSHDALAGWHLIGHNLLHAGWAGVDLFFVLSGFLITGILLDARRTSAAGVLDYPGRRWRRFAHDAPCADFHHAGAERRRKFCEAQMSPTPRRPGSEALPIRGGAARTLSEKRGPLGAAMPRRAGSRRSECNEHRATPDNRARSSAAAYFGAFYARRALRIFPLYFAVLAVIAIVTASIGNPHESAIWRDWSPWLWFYAGNIYNSRHGWMVGPHGLLLNHLWSLAVEEQFYLVWPLVVFACGRRPLRFGCASLIFCAVALRFYLRVIDGNNYAATLLMPCRLDAFGMGGLLALAVREAAACQARLARIGWVMAGVSAVLVLPMFLSFAWMDVVGRSALAILFGGVLLLAVFSPLRAVFEFSLLRIFGKYSYGLYVLHFLLYRSIDKCFPADQCGTWLHFAGCVAVSFGLAFCSWHLMEKHFLRLKERFKLQGNKPRAQRSGAPDDARTTKMSLA